MRYFTKFAATKLNRLEEVVNLQWNILGNHIHLIASACYPFPSVLRALAEPSFVLPAEGLPGCRYLPGSKIMDLVEIEGENHALSMFGNPPGYRATLQPHSGTQANQIVFNAILRPDDTVLCMRARDGGHISHTVLIGRRNKTINFGLTPEGLIDYSKLRELAIANRPRLIIVGGSALPRAIDFTLCAEIAKECGAYLHADISHTATFIAARLHTAVFPYCDFATFNTVKNLRGPNGGVLIYRESLQRAIYTSIFPTSQGGANENNMLAKFATFLEWRRHDIKTYAEEIVRHANVMVSVFRSAGINVVTNGTDSHIVLLDLSDKEASGAEFEHRLEDLGVLVNKNLVPNDKRSPSATSGIRIGTTNLAILNYDISDTSALAHWIVRVIYNDNVDNTVVYYLIRKYHQDCTWLSP